MIAAEHGIVWPDLAPHPRLPAALLLQLPFLLVPLELAANFGQAVAAASLMWAFLEIRLPWWGWVVLAYPAANAVWYGQTSAVVTLMVVLWWTRGWSWSLGAATGLRIWPWFLGLARWDWKAGVWFGGLNLAGLLLPGVSVAGTVDAFTTAADTYVGGGVTSMLPWWVPIVVAVLWLFVRDARLLVPVALLLSPVVWLHYLTVLAVPLGAKRKAPRPSEEERGANTGLEHRNEQSSRVRSSPTT